MEKIESLFKLNEIIPLINRLLEELSGNNVWITRKQIVEALLKDKFGYQIVLKAKSNSKNGWSNERWAGNMVDWYSALYKQGKIDNTFYERKEIDSQAAYRKSGVDDFKERYFKITDENVIPAINVDIISKEVSELIQNLNDEKGRIIGIFGQWGRGKTFMMSRIWEQLKSTNKYEKIYFHAWKYQDSPAIWAYLYETFATNYFNSKSQNFKLIRLNVERKGIMPLLRILFSFLSIIIWYFIIETKTKINILHIIFDFIGSPTNIFSILTISSLIGIIRLYRLKPKIYRVLKMYNDKVSYKFLMGQQAEIQEELLYLVKAWIPQKQSKKKLLIFIDDIDRCIDDKILSVIDSIRVMLEEDEIYQRIIAIIAIDERILKNAIELKYKNLKPEIDFNKLTEEYLDKIFISGIKLNSLYNEEKGEIFDIYTRLNGSVLITNNEFSSQVNKEIVPNEVSGYSKTDESVLNIKKNDKLNPHHYELSPLEYTILRKEIINFPDITPRQIRILHYRYLLYRNLLFKLNIKIYNIELVIKVICELSKHKSKDLIIKNPEFKKSQPELIESLARVAELTIPY